MTKMLKDVLGLVGTTKPETASASMETARMENTVVGQCPCCKRSMATIDVGDIPCYVCVDDCVCLPTAD